MIDFEFIALIVLGLIGWLWFDSFTAHELALRTARRACESEGLLLLDESVSISSLRPVRNRHGQLRLRRIYTFEFSDTGDNRRNGGITLLGEEIEMIDIGLRLVVNG